MQFLLRLGISIFLCLFFLPAIFGLPATFYISERTGKNQITFESKAPLEFIEGRPERIEGSVNLDFSKEGLALAGSVAIPVESMRTGMKQRDDHLFSRDWMDGTTYPFIRFDLDTPATSGVIKKGHQKWFTNVIGHFKMKGISKKISVPVTLWIRNEGKDEKIYIQGRFAIRLSDFSISGPSAIRMLGVRVSEVVDINLKLVGVADKGWEGLR